jgi:hypothetical protein
MMFRIRHPPIRHSRFGCPRRFTPPAIAIFRSPDHSENRSVMLKVVLASYFL